MSRIKGKNTKPEMLVRRYLFVHGFRYRLKTYKTTERNAFKEWIEEYNYDW